MRIIWSLVFTAGISSETAPRTLSAEDTQPDYSEADIPDGLAVTTTVSAEPTEELPEYEEITPAMETTTVTTVIPDDELYGE